MRIKSAEGRRVRDHITRLPIPAEGLEITASNGIPDDPYWQFMLRHEDVVSVEPGPVPHEDVPALPAPDAAPATPGEHDQ